MPNHNNQDQPTIAEIVRRLGLDTDKTTAHSYGEFYDVALAPYRRPPVRLLEIGVHAGGSIRLWHAYFERAEIVGVDIGTPPAGLSGIATIVRGDAYDEATATALGAFDVVIDDGPHALDSMLGLIRLYLPRLRPGGLMVIEDVQDPAWFAELEAAVPDGYPREAIDRRPVKGRYDDLLFVIRNPA
jgi:Methyltransferase domain